MINNDTAVRNTYGNKQFTFEEIIHKNKGLKDTSWIDMWTMDMTQGILSDNGIIAKVIFNSLTTDITKKSKEALEIAEATDKLTPKVLRRLSDIGQKLKSKGVDGTSNGIYTIFLGKNKNGQLTGGYSYKFNSEYENEVSKAENNFSEQFNNAKLYTDFESRNKAFAKAFANKRAWTRNNQIIIEFNKLPEVISECLS